MYTDDLPDSFFDAFVRTAQALRTDALALIKPLMNESGVKPSAYNVQGGAAGIFQAMPFTLKRLGYNDTSRAFSKLSAEQQLPWLEKYYEPAAGKLPTSVHVYMWTFVPGLLSHASNPGFIICAKDGSSSWGQEPGKSKLWYAQNSGLDKDKDGKITPHDLGLAIDDANASPRGRELASRIVAALARLSCETTDPDLTPPSAA